MFCWASLILWVWSTNDKIRGFQLESSCSSGLNITNSIQPLNMILTSGAAGRNSCGQVDWGEGQRGSWTRGLLPSGWVWILHLLEERGERRRCEGAVTSQRHQRRRSSQGDAHNSIVVFFFFFNYFYMLGSKSSDNIETKTWRQLLGAEHHHLQWPGHGQHQLHEHHLQRCSNSDGETTKYFQLVLRFTFQAWKHGLRLLTNNNKINNVCPMESLKKHWMRLT